MTRIENIKKKIADKVDGIIKPEHTSDGHFYRFPNGTLQVSVTGKLGILDKPHLKRWAVKKAIEWLETEERWKYLAIPTMRNNYIQGAYEAHTEIRDDAGSVGTSAHDAAERYIKHWIATNEKPTDIKKFFKYVDGRIMADPRAIAAARGLEDFFTKHNIIPLASEILVGNHRVSAGTLDFLCLMEGKLTLIDFKTSNSISEVSFSLQVSLYKKFFEYMTGLKITQTKIIHLSKDYNKFTVYRVLAPAEAYDIGKKVCQVYDWMYNGREKIIKDVRRLII